MAIGNELHFKRHYSSELALDAQFTKLLFRLDRDQLIAKFSQQVSMTVCIVGAATHVVDLGTMTGGKVLVLLADNNVNLLINGSPDPVPVRVQVSGIPALVHMETSITSLSIVNPVTGAADATVTYLLAGD